MSIIKIISNPYEQNVKFQSFSKSKNNWVDINPANNTGSKLLKEEFSGGFFPFKAKEILDIICSEYKSDSDPLIVEFEGTDDEFKELLMLNNLNPEEDRIEIRKSGLYLDNARDILKDVKSLFSEIEVLIRSSIPDDEKLNINLKKFTDASDDVIPICVIGNYSSGKSTFINALLGYEILPSSDEPTTAKIYEITQSKYADRGKIQYFQDDNKVTILFKEDETDISIEPENETLFNDLNQLLIDTQNENLVTRIKIILETLNTYANNQKDIKLSDVIEITGPFNTNSIWSRCAGTNFIVFDTPGSNSASNINHSEVLHKALEEFSNGLPIFISEYGTLDTTDNEKLYQDIMAMEVLDDRFTMLIINKADAASLKKGGFNEADKNKILSYPLPRKINSAGIYFVSSIIALGHKNKGKFLDDHNWEIYEDQIKKYQDPTSNFYKQLYKYNILPLQIGVKSQNDSENISELIYANSGMYAVEKFIETFSETYSSYNKCAQAQMFLNNLILESTNQIEKDKKHKEILKSQIEKSLEEEKIKFINDLNDLQIKLMEKSKEEYSIYLDDTIKSIKTSVDFETLNNLKKWYKATNSQEQELEIKREAASEALKKTGSELINGTIDFIKKRGQSSKEEIFPNLVNDLSQIKENWFSYISTGKNVKNKTDIELIDLVRENFIENLEYAQNEIWKKSKEFWIMESCLMKEELLKIIQGEETLSKENRISLAYIVNSYPALEIERIADEIFEMNRFKLKIFKLFDILNMSSLVKEYNRSADKEIDFIYGNIKENTKSSFKDWSTQLLDQLITNIIELSPLLKEKAELINEENLKIAELEKRRNKLERYSNQLQYLLGWKVRKLV